MPPIDSKELQKLKQDIKTKGYVDREHLLQFLTLVPTSEATVIISEVKNWLQQLHDDQELSGVSFPKGDIDAIIGDLDSYGRVQPNTILEFKQSSNKAIPQVS